MHSYLNTYESILKNKKYSATNVLEIGIGQGGGLKLWDNFFTNAKIYGVDTCNIDDIRFDDIKNPNHFALFTKTDAYNKDFVQSEFIDKGITFDLIVDDGPHTLESMVKCIELYSNILTNDGILIIQSLQNWDWVKTLGETVPEHLKKYIFTYDLRNIKNRYDDILFVINKSISKPTIILTTTVHVSSSTATQIDKNERIQTYIKSINQWLLKTNLNIVVVENSGYSFDELANYIDFYKYRFQVITFRQENDGRKLLTSKGGSEISSIHYAYHNSSIIKSSQFIIKLTGRYFIDELEDYLSNYNLNNYDTLSQNNQSRCEMVGTDQNNFFKIFSDDLIDKSGNFQCHIELVYEYRFSLFSSVLRCKVLNIEPTKCGGTNNINTTI